MRSERIYSQDLYAAMVVGGSTGVGRVGGGDDEKTVVRFSLFF
jgi:hypothetical protein